ncbi:hypothetical protein G6F65_018231 [Rhizopus arrhizus]|nr:hypothetical protein G6F65_018231 [Rhizopus arrhizus]
MRQRAIDLPGFGVEHARQQMGIEQGAQRRQAYPEHAAGRELSIAGCTVQAQQCPEPLHAQCIAADVVGHLQQVACRSHQADAGIGLQMGQVRSSLGRAQQRVDHLAPPLVAIVTMAGALDPDFSGQALRIDDRLHLCLTLPCGGDDQACLQPTVLHRLQQLRQRIQIPRVDDDAGTRRSGLRGEQRAPGGMQPGMPETGIRFKNGAFRPFVPGIDEHQAPSGRYITQALVHRVVQPVAVATRRRMQ